MPFSLKEGLNTLEVHIDSKNEIKEGDETDNHRTVLVTVKEGQITKITRADLRQQNKRQAGPMLASTKPKTNIAVKNLMAYPNEEGLFQIGASIFNTSDVPVGQFSLYFYVNDPDKKHPKHHMAGPIQPGGRWNEGTRPVALREGLNTLEVVIDSKHDIAELNETDNELMIQVEIKEGQVVELLVMTR